MEKDEHIIKTRDPLFDVVKFCGILLVIVGHVFNKGYASGTPAWFSDFRDEMTMPLFFTISGYFAMRPIENGDWHKLIRNVRSYLQPLLVLSLIFTPCYYLFEFFIGVDVPSVTEILVYPVKRFLFAGWFVWVLSFSYSVAFLCYRPVAQQRWQIKLIVVLGVAVGLYFLPELPGGACQVQYLPLMFPFLWLAWSGVRFLDSETIALLAVR